MAEGLFWVDPGRITSGKSMTASGARRSAPNVPAKSADRPLQTQTAGDGPAACTPQPTLAGGIENRLRGVGTAIPDLCHNERSEPVDVTGYSRSRGTRLRLDRL